jgi:glycosyltransferase involved in cell wall biosynthesis
MKIGIYQAYWGQLGGGQRYVGAAAQVLARQHSVEIVHHSKEFDPSVVAAGLELDFTDISFRHVPRKERPWGGPANPWRRLRAEREWQSEISRPYDLFIDNSDNVPFFCHAPRGVLITCFPLVRFEEFHGHQTDAWRRRPGWLRWLSARYHRLEWRKRFATYELVLTCSEYSRQWLRTLWGVDAAVVYPPVRNAFRRCDKANLIVAIGAFAHGQHKKHGTLIEAFGKLCDGGLTGWELALVGALKPNEEDREYLEKLRAQAGPYPVTFHANASAGQLRGLLEQAAVFWHAMGHGVDPQADPARLEHFGMVAVEAMAAGCVPLLFDGGGLREIVLHSENGLLWRTVDELCCQTRRVAGDEGLRRQLAHAATVRAHDFTQQKFAARLLEALGPVLSQSHA